MIYDEKYDRKYPVARRRVVGEHYAPAHLFCIRMDRGNRRFPLHVILALKVNL